MPFYGETTSGAAHKQFEGPRQARQVQAAPPRAHVPFEGQSTAAATFKVPSQYVLASYGEPMKLPEKGTQLTEEYTMRNCPAVSK